jgi:hypothetical protein
MAADDKIITNAPAGLPEGELGMKDAAATSGEMDASVQASLGDMLRRYFDRLVDEPLPDQIVKLIEELEQEDASRKSVGTASPRSSEPGSEQSS